MSLSTKSPPPSSPPPSGFSIVLYQPDIAGNTGTILRMGACLGIGIEIVEPAGFDASDRNLRRAGMDYLELAQLTRHVDFESFERARREAGRRLVLLTTRGDTALGAARFRPGDAILFGRESAGVPEHVHERADLRLRIPMQEGARSLNLAVSTAIAAGEALRQLRADWTQGAAP